MLPRLNENATHAVHRLNGDGLHKKKNEINYTFGNPLKLSVRDKSRQINISGY